MNTVFIALLDKSYPPEHSFVDGMLATELAKAPDIRVRLCVSHSSTDSAPVGRYGHAVCIPVLKPRRGINRLTNFWIAGYLLVYQIRREKLRGRNVVLFVRNDPVYLLIASLLRKWVDTLIFQSSFPHEEFSGGRVKRYSAKILYKFAANSVDSVLAVSPAGLERVRTLFPQAKYGGYIPLLSDLSNAPSALDSEAEDGKTGGPIVFGYIGTHAKARKLEIVLQAVVQAIGAGIDARFLFVGGKATEIDALMVVPGVDRLVQNEIIRFEPRVSRTRIPEILAEVDVGLSLIPPSPAYREASPTKLAEYMGAGLAVLASRGIPLQEQFVNESGGGLLVDWNSQSIADGIVEICVADTMSLMDMKRRSLTYAATRLNYACYLPLILRMVGRGCSDEN